tara:strand:- start:599 stop:1471 length:873 start_codon:yes stop_codon:yes gene_type:complete
MDTTQIILAALGGGLAALVGVLIGAMLPRSQGPGLRFGNILAMGLALAGARFLPPVLDPLIGEQVRAAIGRDAGMADEIAASIEALFVDEPLFAALAEADPDEAGRISLEVEQAYLDGGMPAASRRGGELGRELGEQAMSVYGPRASDAALEQFFVATRDWGRSLQDRPERCYSVFYSSISSAPPSTEELVDAAVGTDTDALQAAMADVVRSAGPEAIAFDAGQAALAQQEVGETLLQSYAAQDLRFMLGAVPQNTGEMQLACDVMLAMLDLMLAHEDSALLLRASVGAI